MDASKQNEYLIHQLRLGLRKTLAEQERIAQKKIYSKVGNRYARSRSGALLRALQQPSYKLTAGGGGALLRVDYPLYLRFLDMKSMGNYRIYNRPVWGIFYKDTLKNIKYEYRDWLRSTIHAQLSDAAK